MLFLKDGNWKLSQDQRERCRFAAFRKRFPMIRLESIRCWTSRSVSDVCDRGGEHTDTFRLQRHRQARHHQDSISYVQPETARA
jgi:hypothetical protein